MVETRCDVCDERAEGIEGCAVALLDLAVHVLPNLVHGHMAGTFDKCLHAMIPRTRHQLTHGVELGKLGGIIGIVGRTGTEAVTQGDSHVIAMADLTNIVEMGI